MFVHLEDLELFKKQHAQWDELLKEEEKSSSPNLRLIQSYKRHKLEIKDKIQKVENELFKGA